MTSSDFVGNDFEYAYAKAFGGEVSGGFDDGGRDVIIPKIGGVQVKASADGAKSFLAVSIKRNQFIPLCVGEPGAQQDMIESLKRFGAWVGNDIPNRVALLTGIAQVRAMIEQAKGGARVRA